MVGLVFGMCLSANFAAREWGGCSGEITLQPSSPCEVFMAALNCTLSMIMVYFAYQLLTSGQNGGGAGY